MSHLYRRLRAAFRIITKHHSFDVRLCSTMAVNEGRLRVLVARADEDPGNEKMWRILLRCERHMRRVRALANRHGHSLD